MLSEMVRLRSLGLAKLGTHLTACLAAHASLACGYLYEPPCGGELKPVYVGYCPLCIPSLPRVTPIYCHRPFVPRVDTSAFNVFFNTYRCDNPPSRPPPDLTPVPVAPPPVPPPPAIEIVALPSVVTISGGTLGGLQGYRVTIDLSRVDFITPDPDLISPNGATHLGPATSLNPADIMVPTTCADIGERGADGAVWKHALLTMRRWHDLYPAAEVMINTNWFDVTPPFTDPHRNLCTNLRGMAYTNGRMISPETLANGGQLLDALLLHTTLKGSTMPIAARIVKNADIARYNAPVSAVAGYVSMVGGNLVPTPSSNNPEKHFARTAVGLSADGSEMTMVVEQRGRFEDLSSTGGLTAAEMALLLKSFGAADVINLDNSGSSQIVAFDHAGDSLPAKASLNGDIVTCDEDNALPPRLKQACSVRERAIEDADDGPGLVRRDRPVPSFLGVKAK